MLDDYIRDLKPLVDLDAGSHNPAGVTCCAQQMKALYESIGFTAELVDLGPTVGKGMIAKNKPEATEFDVMLNGHLDTVFPDGTAAKRPFTVTGDRATGPGVADCKAGVLSSFYALKTARREDLDRLSIVVCYNPDEETGSNASHKWLCEVASHAKCALIFEAARANGQLVRSRKGVATYEVTFTGKASHAGNAPHDGANANIAACRFALAAAGLADVLKGTTVNPGVVQGGTAANVIADKARVVFDTRYWNDADGDTLEAGFKALAQSVWAPRVTQTLACHGRMPAMPYSEDAKVLVEKINRAAELEGFQTTWVDAGGGSDGNRIAGMGIPVVDGCGPAGGEFHSDREYLRLDTVEERIRMISRLLTLL